MTSAPGTPRSRTSRSATEDHQDRRSFVSPSKASIYNDTLLEAIVSLGQKLDMTVLAEGIETQGQLERVRHLGCELGQGYLFSPAVPAVSGGHARPEVAWLGQRLALLTSADPPLARNGRIRLGQATLLIGSAG